MTDRRTTPQVIDFETFATQRGASFADYGDAGAHSPAGHMPKRNWRQAMRAMAERNAELAQRRSELVGGVPAPGGRGQGSPAVAH